MTVGRFKFVLWTQDPDLSFRHLTELYEKYEWSYYHAALEHCPTTGRQHIDGYLEYPTQRRWATENKKWVKKFGKGYGDLRIATGTAAENLDYSEKEGGRFETQGTASKGQGFRTDLATLKEDLLTGKRSVDECLVEDPMLYHQYGRTLHRLEDLALRKLHRSWMTTCLWLHGPTGTGKSERAFKDYHPDTHYLWKNDNGWQDGYAGQATVIINDFRSSDIPYHELLQMIDRYPYFLRRRGREPCPFLAKHIIITSSMHPDDMYADLGEPIEQLMRRITVQETFTRDPPSQYLLPGQYGFSFDVSPEV